MPIKETQLDIWSKQGSVSQSKATYATIRLALDANDAPYYSKEYSIFLQGSYGNDTNIYADSDVDTIITIDSIYYSDLDNLSEREKNLYESAKSSASYTIDDFKKDVVNQLHGKFGSSVEVGNKAIYIKGNGSRRDADVVAAATYRRFTKFEGFNNQSYIEGICFWTKDNTKIVNYPKQHSANCTSKHDSTSYWFKPMVRILKNMRNSMIEKGYIAEGVAPSYFLEGMLYNVPADNFGRSYVDTFVNSINWLKKCDRSNLVCANEQYYLLRPGSPVTWREEKFEEYLNAVSKFWAAY